MVLKTQSSEHVTSTHGRFVIGDMGDPVNGKDGIPEVVTAHTDTKKIYILDGKTLDIKYEATAQDRIDKPACRRAGCSSSRQGRKDAKAAV
jgi:hypothetical protein